MHLVLIRHTSVAVAPGVCYGQTDVALAESFQEEAEIVRKNLSRFHFDHVYCSPLSRCTRLADYCGFSNFKTDERLLEINFGEWEMKRYDEIKDPRLKEWYEDYINVAATGGESVIDQRRRFEHFVDELRKLHPDDTIGIFTHAGILINALVSFGLKSYNDVYDAIPLYGAIIEIDI